MLDDVTRTVVCPAARVDAGGGGEWDGRVLIERAVGGWTGDGKASCRFPNPRGKAPSTFSIPFPPDRGSALVRSPRRG